MDRSGAALSGLYRMAPGTEEVLTEHALKLTALAYHVHVADAVALVEVRQTYQVDSSPCDVAAVFPLIALGGSQFAISFTVNNINTVPEAFKKPLVYLAGKSPAHQEQLHPKLYFTRLANVPVGKPVVVIITYAKPLTARGNSLRLQLPMECTNVSEKDPKKLKLVAKKWSAIVACFFQVHVMSKIVSITSSTDKLDVSLSTAKPREALVQFNRVNPLSALEFVVNVADIKAPAFYFSPLEVKPTEVRHPHHVSSAMASFFIDSLNFSATPLPEVILLLDVSSSTKEGGASPTLKKGVTQLIKSLPENTPFNVILFGGAACELMWPKSQLKTKKTETFAKKWAKGAKLAPDDDPSLLTNALLALDTCLQLPRTQGFDRQAVIFTDGLFDLKPEDLTTLGDTIKGRVLRLFCVGYGAPSYRACARLSSVGHGTMLVTDHLEPQKSFLASLQLLKDEIMQPPTVQNRLDMKALESLPVLDFTTPEACFRGQRINILIAMDSGSKPCSGRLSLLMGEGTAVVDLSAAGVLSIWDNLHPMAGVLHKLCGHAFMEEKMQGKVCNPTRTTLRLAMAQELCIECKWVRNVQSDGNIRDTRVQGLISSRAPPATIKDIRPMARTSRLNDPHLPSGTWPRPENPNFDPNAARQAMVDMRNLATSIKLRPSPSEQVATADKLYRSEVEGAALDFALAYMSKKLHVPVHNMSRTLIKQVQKAVVLATARFDTRFATDELASAVELREILHKALDDGDFRAEKTMSMAGIDNPFTGSGGPLLVSVCGKVGRRETGMEDRHVVLPNFYSLMRINTVDDDAVFVGVYDGHAGALAAEYCRQQLHVNMVRQHRLLKQWPEALAACFRETDADFREIAQKRRLIDGTTASVLLIEENQLYHANVGDGEGFLRWKDGRIQAVTHAHKATDEAEVARIRAFEKKNPSKKCLVDLKAGGMAVADPNGNFLRVARSIGDSNYYPEVLTAEPYVGTIALNDAADFVVLASDGLWDVMSFEEVAKFVISHGGVSHLKVAESLVDEAIRLGSQDNVTVVVVFLHLAMGDD